MSNERTDLLRRRYRRTFYAAVITLVVAVGGLRVIELGYQGDNFLTVILAASVAGLLFVYFVDRAFACQGELKRIAMIENQRVYGGGREFVDADDARQQGRDNIWDR